MRVDLHVHTTASDGTVAPVAVVAEAASIGLAAIAITDHDSVEGVAPALAAAPGCGIEVIPGVELSADEDGLDVHILGYFVDHTDGWFVERLLELRHARLERAVQMIDALRKAGFSIDLEDVLQLAAEGSVGRSHVARALMDAGHVASISDAFERLIGRHKPFYVKKPLAKATEVTRWIVAAGGLAVLAHPGICAAESLIDDLVTAGLSGVEAYHFEHTPEQSRAYEKMARARGLVATGGSDYHGPGAPGPGLGGVEVPPETLDELKERASRG